MSTAISSTTAASDLLAARASRGDAEALSELYEHWSDPLYRWVLVKTDGLHHPAEDICQEVWVKVARGIRGFVADRTAGFAKWLFTIARSCVVDAYKRASKRREVPTEDMLAMPTAVVAGPGTDETALTADLAGALDKLNPRRARVITLRFFVGLSVEETADVLGLTPGAVRSAQCRALRDLRSHLGPIITAGLDSPDLVPLKTRAAVLSRGVSC